MNPFDEQNKLTKVVGGIDAFRRKHTEASQKNPYPKYNTDSNPTDAEIEAQMAKFKADQATFNEGLTRKKVIVTYDPAMNKVNEDAHRVPLEELKALVELAADRLPEPDAETVIDEAEFDRLPGKP